MSITAGAAHSCGLREDGTLACWGAGVTTGAEPNFGQLLGPVGSFDALDAGAMHSCGLRSDGSVACWGAGLSANNCDAGWECGQSTAPDAAFIALSAGLTNSCGILRADGKLACWGSNTGGRSSPPPDFEY